MTYRFAVLILLFLAFPFMAILGLAIVFSSGFPVMFSQKRVSTKGRTFMLYKFRTMRVGAEKLQRDYLKFNEADGPAFKIRNDPRFTRVGKFLSHTGLDELPQLWNVLRGEMALIGPRPLPIAEEKKLKKWQKAREAIKPGIISPWILEGYHTKSFDEWMKRDVEYIKQKSFLYDLRLLFKAIVFLTGLSLKEIFS